MESRTLEPFKLRRSSTYIKSIVAPESYCASIPDDVCRRHVIKAVPISASYPIDTITPGLDKSNGMFIVNPLTPSNNVAALYFVDVASNKYKFYTYVQPAQDINPSYNYGRNSTCGLVIQNASLSATGVLLSGTANAATYDSFISELDIDQVTPSQFYDEVLGKQNNPYDKVGPVSLVEGVRVLGLPNSFDVLFTRLSDPTPTLGATTTIKGSVVDLAQSLQYEISQPDVVTIPIAGNIQLYSTKIDQWDNTLGLIHSFNYFNLAPTVTESVTLVVQTQVFDISGIQFGSYSQTIQAQKTIGEPFLVTVGLPLNIPLNQPTVGVSVSVQTNATEDTYVDNLLDTYTVPNAGQMGHQTPITLIPFSGIAQGSQMIIKGMKNYELIPNPVLMKELQLLYPRYDSDEIDYVRQLLYNRDQFQLRSVMNENQYRSFKQAWIEMGDLDRHEYAQAFDFGDILKGLKTIAAPIVQQIPLIGPIASGLMDAVIPTAAGGTPMSYSLRSMASTPMGGTYAQPRAAGGAPMAAGGTPMRRFYAADNESFNIIDSVYGDEDDCSSDEVIKVVSTELTAVAFPIVSMMDGLMEDVQLYGVFPAELTSRFNAQLPSVRTMDGHNVYNYMTNTGMVNTKTGADLVLLRIYNIENLTINIGPSYVVRGSSCEAALTMWQYVAPHYRGVTMPITGGVQLKHQGLPEVKPNTFYPVKEKFCWAHHMPLIGSATDPIPGSRALSSLLGSKQQLFMHDRLVQPLPYSVMRSACAADNTTLDKILAAINGLGERVAMLENPSQRQQIANQQPALQQPPPIPARRTLASIGKQATQAQNQALSSIRSDSEIMQSFPETIRTLRTTKLTDADVNSAIINYAGKNVRMKGPTASEARSERYNKIARSMYDNNKNISDRYTIEEVEDWVASRGAGLSEQDARDVRDGKGLKGISGTTVTKPAAERPSKLKNFLLNSNIEPKSQLGVAVANHFSSQGKPPDAAVFKGMIAKYGKSLAKVGKNNKEFKRSQQPTTGDIFTRNRPNVEFMDKHLEDLSDSDIDAGENEFYDEGEGGNFV